MYLKSMPRFLFYVASLLASAILALTTGCASGGYKLTRQYAGWVNSQNIIIRIILYILTLVVFGVTLLIDSVIFNTIDFWEGRVSDGRYEFKDDNKTYFVQHQTMPETQLKKTTIQVVDLNTRLQKEIILAQTSSGQIDVLEDGKLKTRVRDLANFPILSHYDGNGKITEEKILWLPGSPDIARNH